MLRLPLFCFLTCLHPKCDWFPTHFAIKLGSSKWHLCWQNLLFCEKKVSKKFVESIKQGNWHQSISALRCHRRSLFAFAKYTAKCISFLFHALQ